MKNEIPADVTGVNVLPASSHARKVALTRGMQKLWPVVSLESVVDEKQAIWAVVMKAGSPR